MDFFNWPGKLSLDRQSYPDGKGHFADSSDDPLLLEDSRGLAATIIWMLTGHNFPHINELNQELNPDLPECIQVGEPCRDFIDSLLDGTGPMSMKDAANHSWLQPELRRCMDSMNPLSRFLGMHEGQLVWTAGGMQSTRGAKGLTRAASGSTVVGLEAVQHFLSSKRINGLAPTDVGLTAATVVHAMSNSSLTVPSAEVSEHKQAQWHLDMARLYYHWCSGNKLNDAEQEANKCLEAVNQLNSSSHLDLHYKAPAERVRLYVWLAQYRQYQSLLADLTKSISCRQGGVGQRVMKCMESGLKQAHDEAEEIKSKILEGYPKATESFSQSSSNSNALEAAEWDTFYRLTQFCSDEDILSKCEALATFAQVLTAMAGDDQWKSNGSQSTHSGGYGAESSEWRKVLLTYWKFYAQVHSTENGQTEALANFRVILAERQEVLPPGHRHIIQTTKYIARQLSALAKLKRSRWQECGDQSNCWNLDNGRLLLLEAIKLLEQALQWQHSYTGTDDDYYSKLKKFLSDCLSDSRSLAETPMKCCNCGEMQTSSSLIMCQQSGQVMCTAGTPDRRSCLSDLVKPGRFVGHVGHVECCSIDQKEIYIFEIAEFTAKLDDNALEEYKRALDESEAADAFCQMVELNAGLHNVGVKLHNCCICADEDVEYYKAHNTWSNGVMCKSSHFTCTDCLCSLVSSCIDKFETEVRVWTLSGTVLVVQGGATVRGTDTAFTKELKAGDHTHIVGVGTYIVGSIANDSKLVLTTPVESLEACPNPAESKLALVSAAGQLPCAGCTALTDAGCSSIDIDRHDVYRVLASCPASPALSRTLAAFGRVERKQKEEEERKAKEQEAEEKKALKHRSAVTKAKLLVEEAKHLAMYIPCPGCKIPCDKDGNCIHMHCPSCPTAWCYACGDKTSACKSSAGRGCGQSAIYLEEMPEFKERGLRYTGRGAPSTAGNLARDYFHFKRTQAFILIAQKMIESDDGSVWNQLQSQDPELLNPSNWASEELQSNRPDLITLIEEKTFDELLPTFGDSAHRKKVSNRQLMEAKKKLDLCANSLGLDVSGDLQLNQLPRAALIQGADPEGGADPEADGDWALLQAAMDGDAAIVDQLILQKADVNWADTDNHGQTALHNAVENKRGNVVRLLLECKADVDASMGRSVYGVESIGWTPLHIAVYTSAKQDCSVSIQIVEMLKEAGCNTKRKVSSTDKLNSVNGAFKLENHTALDIAKSEKTTGLLDHFATTGLLLDKTELTLELTFNYS